MKNVFSAFLALFMVICLAAAAVSYVNPENSSFIASCFIHVGYFFIAVTLLIALTWVGLGLRNLVKIYYDIWKAKREYNKE